MQRDHALQVFGQLDAVFRQSLGEGIAADVQRMPQVVHARQARTEAGRGKHVLVDG